MYKNIGEKIKKIAKCMCWLGITASVIVACVLLAKGDFFNNLTYGSTIDDHEETLNWIGFDVLVFGPILSWVDGAFWYGFGELICKTTMIEKKVKKQSAPEKNSAAEKKSISSELPEL